MRLKLELHVVTSVVRPRAEGHTQTSTVFPTHVEETGRAWQAISVSTYRFDNCAVAYKRHYTLRRRNSAKAVPDMAT